MGVRARLRQSQPELDHYRHLMRTALPLLLLLMLASCADTGQPPLNLTKASYTQLTNWQQDDHRAALTTFLNSCSAWKFRAPDKPIGCGGGLTARAEHWQRICQDAMVVDLAHPSDVQYFFEANFTPYDVSVKGSDRGLFTGYYIPEIRGSLKRGGPYQTPVYAAPSDLEKGKEYWTRAEIYAGKLKGRGLEIAWVDDPVQLFFIEIQGSGVVRLAEGGILTIGFADKNNRQYVAIGRTMEEQGLLEPGNVNLFTIKDWLYRNPSQAQRVMEDNPSYVFFRKLPDNNVRGAQNIGLTAERSLAVDWRYIPYGMPVYLQTSLAETSFGPAAPFNQLMIAQDTGGAIRGGIRGDIYFGHGKRAEALAGKQAMKGGYTLLLPNALAADFDPEEVPACAKK